MMNQVTLRGQELVMTMVVTTIAILDTKIIPGLIQVNTVV